jgi:hypothetical protein
MDNFKYYLQLCLGLNPFIFRGYSRDKLYNLLLYIDHSIAYSFSGLLSPRLFARK